MNYQASSIKEIISNINDKLFLPPIQRNFVWDYKRIVNLFDSLYHNYPIGNCIFWKLNPETSQEYPLYKFIREYTESKKKPAKLEKAPKYKLGQDVLGVVDGQQRLSSLFIGLQGTYKKKKNKFIESTLYINLFANGKSDSEDDNTDLFEFLSKEEASFVNDRNLWVEVGEVLKWESVEAAETFLNFSIKAKVSKANKKTVNNRFENQKEKSVSILKTLFNMLHQERIHFFLIDNQNLNEVVNIFTRVNSGGIILKKSDLLFTFLVAQWKEGRDEIDNIVDSLIERGIRVSRDFIMRTCLVLSDLPVKYNPSSFTRKNVGKIRNNWEQIKSSLEKLSELMPELGYEDLPNISENAMIPIAYYIMKGGNCKTQTAYKNLKRYYSISQVNGIFGGSSDQVLDKIRKEIKDQLEKNNTIDYEKLAKLRLPGNKTFILTVEDIRDKMEEIYYGDSSAYFLLSLLYPSVDSKIKRYDIDHIHPRSKFNESNLKKIGIDDPEIREDWITDKRDLLPNLQLLGKKDNIGKKDKTLTEYLDTKSYKEKHLFMNENLIPKDRKLQKLNNFDEFFEARKKLLVNKLKRQLVF